MANGRLYLIPSPLGEYDPAEVIPRPVLDRLKSIRKYVVEEVRTVRRYLSAAGLKGHIGELELRELNEHSSAKDVEALLDMFSDPDGTPTDDGGSAGHTPASDEALRRGGHHPAGGDGPDEKRQGMEAVAHLHRKTAMRLPAAGQKRSLSLPK